MQLTREPRIARGSAAVWPAVFFDIGWAGDRDTWSRAPGIRLGAGITTLDVDVPRGLSSDGRWRADLYFELR